MPPPGAPRPPLRSGEYACHLPGGLLDKASAANFNPGSVRIHRLNRAEYANAMRDLFGIDVDAAALLPTDDISDGFDNIASALKVSPSFLDQYIMAARAVAKQAIGTPPHRQRSEDDAARDRRRACRCLPELAAESPRSSWLPYEGDYELRAAGNPAVFTVDGAQVDTKGRTHLTAGLAHDRRGECRPQFRRERRRVVRIRSRRGGNRLLQHGPDGRRRRSRWQRGAADAWRGPTHHRRTVRSIPPAIRSRPPAARASSCAALPIRRKKRRAPRASCRTSRGKLSGVP